MNLALYAMIDSDDTQKIARVFAHRGWRLLKAGAFEYEVETPDAEVIVEAQSPVLVQWSATNVGTKR